MAVTAEDVMALLEDDADAHGYGLQQVKKLLAAGKSLNRIAESYYRKRAAQVLYLVNVSESGSSRGMDAVFPRMIALANMYGKAADLEEAQGEEDTNTDQGRFIRSWDIGRA